MNSITPVDSQVSSRSFSMRCSVFFRSDALPGNPRSVATLTPYSSVGATQMPNSAERSSARCSTISVSAKTMRVPLGLACVALVVMCGLATRSQLRLVSFSNAPAVVGAEQAADQRALLKERVDAELDGLRAAAARARQLVGEPPDVVR